MNCSLYSPHTGCRRCGRFLKTVEVVADGGEVVLLVPERVFDNFETLCLCIAKILSRFPVPMKPCGFSRTYQHRQISAVRPQPEIRFIRIR